MSRRNSKGKPWPADEVQRRTVADLVPYARNARTHSDEQVAQLAASIELWGWTIPVLVDEAGGVIAGHGRLLAAEQLGIEQVPTMVARGWSRAEKRAYVVADNKLTLNADWDDEILRAELGALEKLNFDLPVIGFDTAELKDLLADVNLGLTDADDVPDDAPVVSRLGDVWHLGRHRLVCGDCTDAETVTQCLGEANPNLMVADPPYGVEYDAAWRNRALRANGKPNGGRAIGAVENDDRSDWRDAWKLFPGRVAYIWHAGLHGPLVAESLNAVGFKVRAQIIWVKHRPVLSRGHYNGQHEPAFYAVKDGADDDWRFYEDHEVLDYVVKDGATADWRGGHSQSTVWFIEHIKSETGHSTQKPVQCMQRPMLNNSGGGDAVYDPFVGSGTTIIAAEITGRTCLAIELNPTYVDVCVERWQNFTGEKATRERRRPQRKRAA